MAQVKTKQTSESAEDFLNRIADERKRRDSFAVLELMKKATGEEPKMWGANIVGFGNYQYKYASGREGDWFLAGFAPRKGNITLYIMAGFSRYQELLARLGKHKTGNSCLHINRIEDVNADVLSELVSASVEAVKQGKIKL